MIGMVALRKAMPALFEPRSGLTSLDIADAAKQSADYESSVPTGEAMPSMDNVAAWEDLLIGLKTNTGQIVTPERARRCATVLSIMRGIAEDVSGLALPLYKHGVDEDVVAYDHPVHRILNVAPNEFMTPMELREHMMFDFFLSGQFFNLKNLSQDPATYGDLESVWPLQANYVTRRWRELIWTFSDPTTGIAGSFTPDTVWRGTILSTNGLDGQAITLLARDAIGLLLAAEEQGARLFSQGVQTDLTLQTDQELDADTKTQLRQAFMQRHSSSKNAFMPMLLESGLKAERIGLTAEESQFLEARKFQVAEIARVFRYPEVLLGGSGKSSTYASAEQFFMSYTKHTLGPWATRIEQTIHRDLLTGKEQAKYFCRHDFSSLLRADEAARVSIWNQKISAGWAQPCEARRAENMPYKKGLDYFNRSLNQEAVGGVTPAPTDMSGLAARVGKHVFDKERKALLVSKQDADSFYQHFGAYIMALTGAPADRVTAYLLGRGSLPEASRFSPQAESAAISTIMNLCFSEEK